jgi:ATP phosphoribosyltransferase
MNPTPERPVRLALPKGRMEPGVFALLSEAGIRVQLGSRNYRPRLSVAGFEAKLLKPQNVIEMLAAGTRDVGFAGDDWVQELEADVVEVLDTGLDPVRIVAAAPGGRYDATGPLRVASEYARLARRWAERRGLDARIVRTWGATEVFPPEDADLIVDNSASGETLSANGLEVVDEVLRSSTRLYASRAALEDPDKRMSVERMALLLRSALEARMRVMLELNVGNADLERVVEALPCMRQPTIATLFGESGYSVRAAVPRHDLPTLLIELRALGGTDIIVSNPAQIVP